MRAPAYILALMVAAVGIGGALWSADVGRSPGGGPFGDGEAPSDTLGAGATEYARIPMAPLAAQSIEQIRATLDATDVRDAALVSSGESDALLDQVAEFLHYRFAEPSPDAYIQWRRDRGYRWRDWDELNAAWTIDEAWPVFVGSPFPSDGSSEHAMARLFARLFQPALDWGDGHNRPVALASAPKGAVVVPGVLTPGNPQRVAVEGEMSAELWHGHTGATACSWWEPPMTIDALLAARHPVEYAEVGLVLEFADGSRRPVIQTWLRSPTDNRWRLQYMNSYNTVPTKLSAWYY